MSIRLSVAAVLIATLECGCCFAQSRYAVDQAVAAAVANRLAADEDLKNFTYTEDRRWSFVDAHGRTPERHETYEYTIVANQPYLKQTERQGKQLSGGDLKHEEKRYGESLTRNKGFDLPQRAEHGEKYVKVDDSLNAVPGKYIHTLVRETTLHGVPVWVVQCEPRSHSGETRTFTLWIDPAAKTILRFDFAVHEDRGEILDGSFGTEEFANEHGVMLPARVQHHLRMAVGGSGVVESDNEHVYTGYKRYQTSVRLFKPGEENTEKRNDASPDGKTPPQ